MGFSVNKCCRDLTANYLRCMIVAAIPLLLHTSYSITHLKELQAHRYASIVSVLTRSRSS